MCSEGLILHSMEKNIVCYLINVDFKVFLEDNRFYDEAVNLFSDSYLK